MATPRNKMQIIFLIIFLDCIVPMLFNRITILLIRHKFFLVEQGAFACNHFKIFVKGGKIIEAAFITELLNAETAFDEQFAGVAYSYLNQKFRVCFSCSGFKIPTEGIKTDVGDG